jgi:hypothetical protein
LPSILSSGFGPPPQGHVIEHLLNRDHVGDDVVTVDTDRLLMLRSMRRSDLLTGRALRFRSPRGKHRLRGGRTRPDLRRGPPLIAGSSGHSASGCVSSCLRDSSVSDVARPSCNAAQEYLIRTRRGPFGRLTL